MKQFRKYWLLILPAILLVAITLLFWQSSTSLRSEKLVETTPVTTVPPTLIATAVPPTRLPDVGRLFPKTPKEVIGHEVWIPNWGSSSGLSSLNNNSANLPQFSVVSPVWYELKPDGSLSTKYPSNKKQLIEKIRKDGSKLIPTVAMFDHELFTKALATEGNLNRHVAAVIKTVIDNGYDGIDLDYESTKLADKEKYFEMIRKISEGLHKEGKLLYVAVLPKWGDEIVYPSLKETRQVQDWSELAKYVDLIRIMTYDYTFARAKYPGPIAPLSWMRQVADYALSKAPAAKFSLGIALYSYRWSADAAEPPLSYKANFMDNENGTKNADALQYTEVKNVLAGNQGKRSSYDDESLFVYVKEGKQYAMTYFTPEDIEKRIDLAKEYGFASVSYWRLGSEAELLSNVK